MKSLTKRKMKLLQVPILAACLIGTSCRTMPQQTAIPKPIPPTKPQIKMIKKDDGCYLSTQKATQLFIYIIELESYADKLEIQNKILRGEKL